MTGEAFAGWSADMIETAADIANAKGVEIRLLTDGSISIRAISSTQDMALTTAAGDAETAADMAAVFNPATLAKRWQCSDRHVRNLMETGQLACFRLGGKLARISRAEVERFEAAARSIIEDEQAARPGQMTDNTPEKYPVAQPIDPLTRARLKRLRGSVDKGWGLTAPP